MSTSVFIPYTDLLTPILLLLASLGVGLLWFGGDWLTRGAGNLASALGINPVVVGLTVVAVTTSMPELITCLIGALEGNTGLVMGNIIGSNLANIGLILGIAAMIRPIRIQFRLIIKECPILIGVTGIFLFLCLNGLTRWEGITLLVLLGVYFFFVTRESTAIPPEIKEEFITEFEEANYSLGRCLTFIGLGGVALALGADVLIKTSVVIAERQGVSDFLIGFTLVAIGTSLPELATSVVAAARNQGDLCAGNIIGSNIFNMLMVGGSVAVIVDLPVEAELFSLEMPAMLLLTVLLLPIFIFGRRRISRLEGALLVALYGLIIGVVGLSQLGVIDILPKK